MVSKHHTPGSSNMLKCLVWKGSIIITFKVISTIGKIEKNPHTSSPGACTTKGINSSHTAELQFTVLLRSYLRCFTQLCLCCYIYLLRVLLLLLSALCHSTESWVKHLRFDSTNTNCIHVHYCVKTLAYLYGRNGHLMHLYVFDS